jgi:YD repeat-containing protein
MGDAKGGLMKALRRTLLSWLFYFAACPVLHAQALNEADPEEQVLRRHAAFLNELSDRRRLNSFFQNEQSVFYGVPIRYVNSFRGNLTFARRDLVTVGRIPIVLARIYDSSRRTGSDFGPGWHLSLAEYMVRNVDGTLTYVDDSASELVLVRSAGGYALGRPGPTDIASIDAEGNAIVVTRRDGWSKRFLKVDDWFLLTAIRDRHGNTLNARYDGKQLRRIEAQDGRFVAIERDGSGRIRRITDDQRRTVAYAYEPRGQLQTVIDLGGNPWKYEYDRLGRLERVIDPRDVATAVVAYDSADKVKKVAILGAQYEYRYAAGDTFITDNAKRLTRVSHSRDGMATSVTSPNGLISELVLDTHNRVTTLLHNGSSSAAFTYDSAGRLDTVTRFEEPGAIRLTYEYDEANRPTRIAGTDGSSVVLEYNAAGDLLRRKRPEETQEFEYSPQGDLLSMTRSGESTFYTHNSYGQIETIRGSRGITRLRYFADGRLSAIEFADGAVYQYRYNVLGFRERVERNDGTRTTYEYDVTGNLIRSEGHQHGAYGGATGQTFEVNDNNQPEVIRFSDGEVMKVLYDATGNPERITTADPEAPALEYLYDVTNRLVAVQDGEAIAGSYTYEDTEPDLRLQMDYRTMRIESGAVRQSASIGDILSMVYTRAYGSLGEAVRFDEPTRAFDLISDDGIPTPNAVILNSLKRRNLVEVDSVGPEARADFDRPSNAMFLPPEYASINCAACVFTGAILKGNNVTGSLTVQQGTSVILVATKTPTSTCPEANIGWTWAINNVPMPWNESGTQVHTFTTLGTHQVKATGECTPCDVIRTATLTVNVTTTPPPSCGSNATLTTQTVATIPSNRSRTKLGVGEVTTLRLSPAPNCPVTWGLSGGSGAISGTSGSSITFTAHERASTATVTATVNGNQRSITYNVVEPVTESAIRFSTDNFPAGIQGAGMILKITIAPTDVSFQNVESQEVSGPATSISGYFTDFAPATLAHVPAGWVPIGEGNAKFDHAQISGFPSPWRLGGFQWVIPIQWRVMGSVNSGTLPNRLQTFTIHDSTGNTTVSKLGVSVTRSP